jgi:mannitol 2-dehydrogenase
VWLLPVIQENLAAGRDVTLSAAVVASWARYAEGVDEQGEPIKLADSLADTLQRIAAQQRKDPLAFVKNRELFGDLASEPAFTEPYRNALTLLHTKGARATLEALATRSSPV